MAHFNTGEQADVHGRTKKRPITLPRADGPMQSEHIPIIDLFAGPGGLSEGFEAFHPKGNRPRFRVVLSIECDPWAHSTLELRSFFRQFSHGQAPPEYYAYLRGDIDRAALFQTRKFRDQARMAARIARRGKLGDEKETPASTVDQWILDSLKQKGPHSPWILVGGPPCQAYSLVGRARRARESRDSFERDERHLLYLEYLRILDRHRPSVFLMENVKGILSAHHGGDKIFQMVCDDLSGAGYRLYTLSGLPAQDCAGGWLPASFVIRAEQHGIPQTRHRVFILGVREADNLHPKSLQLPTGTASAWSAIEDLPRLRSAVSRRGGLMADWEAARDRGLLLAGILPNGSDPIPRHGSGNQFVAHRRRPKSRKKWFCDAKLGGSVNHEARSHIPDDISRYAFAAAFARINQRSPRLTEFPSALLPDHRNVLEGEDDIPFNDRFRVQLAASPASTITSHISKDGHYYIHPDPLQARSLTVREAARIQTFPDNYFFEGPRTEQYRQVGNAVPPLLARQIAAVVLRLFE